MRSYVILRGAAEAAGFALDALPAIGPHSSRHVHCELQAGRVAWLHTHTHTHTHTNRERDTHKQKETHIHKHVRLHLSIYLRTNV